MENNELTDGMRQALLGTFTVGDHREFPVSVPASTLRALVRRGLAKEPNPLENMGYALTLDGEAARIRLLVGLSRVSDQMSEPKREAYRAALADGRVRKPVPPVPAKDVTEHIKGFHVKLWYKSGSMERIADLEFMTAASLYSEGEDNPRVCAGEVHDSRGMLVASFERCQDPVEALQRHTPATCGRRAVREVEMAHGGRTLVCERAANHGGIHKSTIPGRARGDYWGENQCAPLDTPQERG